jgi:hypothetical protein
VRRGGGSKKLGEGGFTVVEVLIYFVISIIVVAGIYQLLMSQNRLYMKQRELQDVRTSLRGAANMLAYELRQASAADSDLYAIATDSFAIRSVQATGIICSEHHQSNLLRYGLSSSWGEFESTSDDSVLFFASGEVGTSDDRWKVLSIEAVWTPIGGGVLFCAWGDTLVGKGKGKGVAVGHQLKSGTANTEVVLKVAGDVDDVYIGAPVRGFRKTTFGIYQEDGRWWLGRKVGASNTWEMLTGPLRSPTDSGLYLLWYDRYGNTTADPTQVGVVDIILRGESLGKVPKPGEAPGYQEDTITVRVSPRG